MRTAVLLAGLALALGACADPPPGASAPTEAPVEALEASPADTALGLPLAFAGRLARLGGAVEALDRDGDVWAVARVRSDSGAFLVTWADLRGVRVEQAMGAETPRLELDTDSLGPAFYHPTAPSPAFRFVRPEAVVARVRRDGDLGVINGAFFETPGAATTQIAFPVAWHGRVVTGGSSPYGPGRPGAAGRRWDAPLRALALGDTLAHVVPYDAATGGPLGQGAFRDAVVSYAPTAHPTRIATRFHVLGALDADGDGTTETLVVVTSDGRTTNAAPTDLAARLGVAPERQVSLDGGASVFVWNRRAGVLETPAGSQPLPHFVVFRLRP